MYDIAIVVNVPVKTILKRKKSKPCLKILRKKIILENSPNNN